MVGRAAVGAGAQEAHENNLLHACGTRGLNYVCGSLDVNSLICLPPNLTIDTGAVRDSLTPREGCMQKSSVTEVARKRRHLRMLAQACIAAVDAASQQIHAVTLLHQVPCEMPPYKTGAARDCEFHDASLRFKRRRWVIWVGQIVLRKSPTAFATVSGTRR